MSFTTWNPSDIYASAGAPLVLSGGNLAITYGAIGGVNKSGVRAIDGQLSGSGKFYFELTVGTYSAAPQTIMGLMEQSVAVSNVWQPWNNGTGFNIITGNGQSGGAFAGGGSLGAGATFNTTGATLGIAADLTVNKFWAISTQSAGVWNGNGSANPATNVGGYSIPAYTGKIVPMWALEAETAVAQTYTANFGATAFVMAAPSGFVGWPGAAGPVDKTRFLFAS